MAHPGSRTQLTAHRRPPHGGSENYTRLEANTLVSIDSFMATLLMSGDLTLSDGDILLTSNAPQSVSDTGGGGLDLVSTTAYVHTSSGVAGDNESTKITSAGGITLEPAAEGVRISQNDLTILTGDILLSDTALQRIAHTGGAGNLAIASGSSVVIESTDGVSDAVNLVANAAGGRIRLDANAGVDIPTTDLRLDTGDIQMTSAAGQQIVHTGAAGAGLSITSTNGPITLEAGEAAPEAIEFNTPNGGVLFNANNSFVANANVFVVAAAGGDIHLQGTVFTHNAPTLLPQNKIQMEDQDEVLTPTHVYTGYAEESIAILADRDLTTPSAADLITNHIDLVGIALENGMAYEFIVDNRGGGAFSRTLVGGAGVTVQGAAAVAGGDLGIFRVIYTDVAGNAVVFARLN